MTSIAIRRHAKYLAAWVALVILMTAGCNSRTNPAQDFPPTTTPATGSETRSTPRELASADTTTPSPTPKTPTPAPTLTSPSPTGTPSPTASPTLTPPPTPTPSPTSTPTPSATPAPALTQLTSGGCCTQPFWSPDSELVLYIDKPSPEAPTGIWGANVRRPGAAPELLSERIAFFSGDLTMVVEYSQGETAIERLDGPLSDTLVERWTVPSGGRSISMSPERSRIAWGESNDDAPFERRVTEIWVANLDGSDARSVGTLPRGGLSGWISEDTLLLTGRESLESRETIVYTLSLIDGTRVELLRAERPRGYRLSPDRQWMVYFQTFSENAADNGLWLARTDGSERRQLDRALFGDYAWRDERRLLVVPFLPDAEHHELWEYDVDTGLARRLTDPAVTRFKIANGDWSVSPDGRKVAFVESDDRNIWLLTLAE